MKKKINILTSGRFHVLDLAKELIKNGYDVKFYSFVPTHRLKSFGLSKENSISLILPIFPFLVLEKIFKNSKFFKRLSVKALDAITSMAIRKADVTIAMSGLFIAALEKSKNNNSVIIVERGSKHILEQKKILEEVPSLRGTSPVPKFDVDRELKSYEIADYIAIASRHVEESFSKYGNFKNKLFVNPYGVDLSDFYVQKSKKVYDVIMVGNWSYQKGVDLLWTACEDLGLKLLHVGAKGDCEFPESKQFTHQDPVEQRKLIGFYNLATVFCLPSRQEGLAMVQAQAISCGLSVVCSMHTGGQDLKNILNHTENIQVMEDYTVEDLKAKLLTALQLPKTEYIGLDKLSWTAYAQRYDDFLQKI